MPVLIGGSKYTHKKRPKGTRVTRIVPRETIDGGWEGIVRHVRIAIGRHPHTRIIPMVEKRFRSRKESMQVAGVYAMPSAHSYHQNLERNNPTFRNAKKQFRVMNEIMAIKRKKKLLLRIPTTIRLLPRKWYSLRSASLIMSYIPHLKQWHSLTTEQSQAFDQDMRRQIDLLRENGFIAREDAFNPQVNPKTKRCVAYLMDFGTVHPIKRDK